MKFIRAVIIDDEPIAIEVIKELVKQLAPDIQVVGTATDGRDGIKLIDALSPDLVFLDINLPYLSGMEVNQRTSNQSAHIIFTTGDPFQAVARRALDRVDYLDKPIDPSEFLAVIEKVRIKHQD